MKNVSEMSLSSLGRQRGMPTSPTKQASIPNGAINTVNQLFIQMRAIFPAWKNSFPDETSYREAKRLWLETLVNEGITTIEQLQNGIERAKKSNKPFWPSVGEFVGWCKEINYSVFGLPDETELLRRLRVFQGCGMENLHQFKFRSDAEYWLITDLYSRCRTGEWREEKLVEETKKALVKMAKRIKQGEQIPAMAITLPAKVERINPAKSQQWIAKIKADLGVRQ